jgi:hypothetical protein
MEQIGMTHKRCQKNSITLVSLLIVLILFIPTSALADGYYHYTAPDMDITKGDWNSSFKVQRMNWHPWTSIGPVASIQSTLAPSVYGKKEHWHWFRMYHMGGGNYYSHHFHYVNNIEYKETLNVIRTNAPSYSKTGISNVYAWTPYAWVVYIVHKSGDIYPVDQAVLRMDYRNQEWW